MKVDYLFSRRNKWGSRLIAWGSSKQNISLEKVPSHMAVLLDESIVVESTLSTGVRIIPYPQWKLINEELYKIRCIKKRQSKSTLNQAFSLWGKGYDWYGIAFFAWEIIKYLITGEKLSKTNKWQKENRYFCTEYAAILTGEDFSMKTPAEICDMWLKESIK